MSTLVHADEQASFVPRGPVRKDISGWGRVPRVQAEERSGEDLTQLSAGTTLARGLGRSYGDSSLPVAGRAAVSSVRADRIIAFDEATGLLRAEAGFSLHELYKIFLPRGYFTPVSPGTQFVTLGGMVASDVHGKSHHRDGTFGSHVTALKVRVPDGRVLGCSPTVERDLFRATVGGMGLLGTILEVEVRLVRVPSPWIYQESTRIPDIDSFVVALKEAAALWPQTVGWIDCVTGGKKLGRGVLMKGRWAEPDEAPREAPEPKGRLTVPFDLPSFVLGPLTVRAFNAFLYAKHGREEARTVCHPESYFYPLDKVGGWNRLYGRNGITQYQCVLPNEAGPGAARRFLEVLVAHGGASPLCVIKDCGPEGLGLLSFPKPGVSIAVDIPVRPGTQALVDALNEQVLKEGGRIYLAKDAFTRAEHFAAMEPRLAEFQRIRRQWDPALRLRSLQSTRLGFDR